MTRVFVIAGEPSGDRLGGALMAGLRALRPDIAFHGIGGPFMQEQGLESLFPMEELSVMGIAEVLPRYRHLLRRMRQTAAAVAGWQPEVLVTIDSPDFCLRVAARARRLRPGQRVCHYVAPSVWAWRPGRAARMARQVDQVLCLLPFEPAYMRAAGMRADFVGHPVVAEPVATPPEIDAFRRESGIGEARILLVLPGSRRGEVSRLLPVFAGAVGRVLDTRPGMRVVVPTVAPVAGQVAEAVRAWPGSPLVIDPRNMTAAAAALAKRAGFGAAGQGGAALAASGTVSLELAANRIPMVIAYDMAWLSRQIMSRMLRVDTVTLVNLVTGTRAVPEFLGAACRPGAIGAGLADLLASDSRRKEQIDAMDAAMQALGRGGEPPGLRAARAVLDGFGAG